MFYDASYIIILNYVKQNMEEDICFPLLNIIIFLPSISHINFNNCLRFCFQRFLHFCFLRFSCIIFEVSHVYMLHAFFLLGMFMHTTKCRRHNFFSIFGDTMLWRRNNDSNSDYKSPSTFQIGVHDTSFQMRMHDLSGKCGNQRKCFDKPRCTSNHKYCFNWRCISYPNFSF